MAHRPKRGPAGPDIEIGDPFGHYEYQGGAAPGASESGDLQSREFGVPQADIPGGLNHLVNTESHHVKPSVRPQEQPVINDHGVPPVDGTQYEFPEKADKIGKTPKASPKPKHEHDYAVPTYTVEKPGRESVYRDVEPYNVNVVPVGSQPTRVCNLNRDRISIGLLNEDSATDIRIGQLQELLTASAAGTGPAGNGALICHCTNSYTWIPTQGELYAVTTSATLGARLSVLEVTEVLES
jgi:hypothetical protein